ncbi:MAG: hypothetical protein KC548_01400 [Nanoarchaeota archaeon]|nr:hypothetical protein [Nanoarchaeota archaeon]
MDDVYLQNPELLKGQPKKTIGDYVEKKGILVPKRFTSLEEALESNLRFLMRTEGLFEYEGVSGLLESHTISPEIIRNAKINDEKRKKIGRDPVGEFQRENKILREIKDTPSKETEEQLFALKETTIKEYCRLLGIDPHEFKQGLSFSYWQVITGCNRTMIADSAIEGRYHLFSTFDKEIYPRDDSFFRHNYTIFENGKIIQSGPYNNLVVEELNKIPKFIEFYETIRKLPHFDPNNCPLLEFQTDIEGKIYFLQYHRTRDFRQATFSLDRQAREDERVADYVRGATGPEGIIVNTSLSYPFPFQLYDEEEASFDKDPNWIFSETMTRRRLVQFQSGGFERIAIGSSSSQHLPRSKLFNPLLSIGIDERKKKFFSKEEENYHNERAESGKVSTIPLRVISDGRKAYVSRVST